MVALEKLEAIRGAAALPELPPDEPTREISPARVIFLLILLCGIGFGIWQLVTRSSAAAAESPATPVYAPYVDVTLTPTYQFQLPADDPVASAYLGFIVSDPTNPCEPSWGGYYTLGQADQSLDLTARVAQLRALGGDPMVSFGGRDNSELAVGCTDTAALEAAYLAVIDRYHTGVVDFDIEGSALADDTAAARRAQALAEVQSVLRSHHSALHVWLTLPVTDRGLTPQGVAQVRTMLAAHVNLAGVNAMAMDFGAGEGAAANMYATVQRAVYATHRQVQALWQSAGVASSAGAAWGHLGVTVMLGVNDVPGERFTVGDARKLKSLVNELGIARVSVWSLNRDSECGSAFAVTGTLSNNCSGVLQSPLQFTRILSALRGTRTARPAGSTAETQTTVVDNPATSPYPIWDSSSAYVSGYKVVWQGDIYQANWWSQGTAPNVAAADSTTGGPWLLIGPVPAGSVAYKPQLLASAHQRPWSASVAYHAGQKVSFDGLPYVARWYSRGSQPIAQLPGNSSTPWQPLFEAPGEPADTGTGSGN
jgi:chitinase